jgi:hypothetical protein
LAHGKLVTATDTAGNPTTTVDIPANPPANDTISGFLYASDNDKETFTYTFNQQTAASGSITVNAGHEVLLGPTAKGDLIFGQAVCATVAATASTPTAQAAANAAAAAAGGGPLATTGSNSALLITLALILLCSGGIMRGWAGDGERPLRDDSE